MVRIRPGSRTKGVNSHDSNMIKPLMIKLFNGYDSNTINKLDQKVFISMIRIWSSPQMIKMFTAMVRIRPGSQTKRVNSNDLNTIKPYSDLEIMMKTHYWRWKRPCFIIIITIYTSSKYVHQKSRRLKCSKAEDERYSTASGSPLSTYVSPCALEYR